ncbi:MAG: major facilitator transporter [Armatimonadetes bacterium]|nr:major facilitator transporter [Armatimonadota bacterium]
MFKTAVSTANRSTPAASGETRGLSGTAFTLLLAALTALTALSIDMSLPAMPLLERTFGVGVSAVQLSLSLFLIGFAGGQLVWGPLSDRIGRRPVLLGGLAVFTLAGLACAASTSLPALRGLQGIGASAGPVMARAMVRDRFDTRQGAGVLSQITQVMIVAPLIAPTLGGYLLVFSGWPSIFVVLGSLGALLLAVSWRVLPETLVERHAHAGGAGYLREGFRAVLTHPDSLRATLTVCFSYAGMFAYISGSPFILIELFHVPKQHFGLFFALTAAALMAGATTNRILLPRRSPTVLLTLGLRLILAAGVLLALLTTARVGGLAGVIAPMMVYLFGLGLVQPNATAAAMAPHARLAGISSSVIGGLQTAAGALAGYCVGAFYNHTPASLAVTVAGSAVLAFLCLERGRTTSADEATGATG